MVDSWQIELRNSFIRPENLLIELGLPLDLPFVRSKFALQATRSFIANIERGRVDDPLFRQIWPFPEESEEREGFTADCLAENQLFHSDGVIDKYATRSLVVSTSACAIHCRYCFRREFPYPERRETSVQNLRQHLKEKDISEVILSGGDPFVLTDEELTKYFDILKLSENVKTIRFHSRVPTVLPDRFTPSLRNILYGLASQKSLVLVLHVNHAREMSCVSKELLQELKANGFHLLNQSVLLKGVNDSVKSLSELSHTLFAAGVLPYYLHQLDRVKGAHHFEVAEETGVLLVEELRKVLPGYLVPRYVKEVSGEKSKSPIS